ncbi:MAG TPA: DUF5069 domain-containing protein [Candidatus Elarobacter sp.]|nr:DUF5069 domain-containing protein [Candidatus Elarobacter sp.]
MTPVSLASHPPRGPRERLAGLVFTARLVDKLRAALPGGDLNGYVATIGFSALWAYYTKVDLEELQAAVAALDSEAEVEAWIAQRTAAVDKDRANERMEHFASSRIGDELRPLFEQFYPAELRERHPIMFDLLEADDARLYPAGVG